MMTFTLISNQVLAGSASSVTFSSIPNTYKDLVIEISAMKQSTSGNITLQFNNDATALYSQTRVSGNGTTATSAVLSAQTSITIDPIASFTTAVSQRTIDIPNYATSNLYKNVLVRAGKTDTGIDLVVGLYRSNTAISTITLTAPFAINSSFRLWGLS